MSHLIHLTGALYAESHDDDSDDFDLLEREKDGRFCKYVSYVPLRVAKDLVRAFLEEGRGREEDCEEVLDEMAHLQRCKEILVRAVGRKHLWSAGARILEDILEEAVASYCDEEKRWLGIDGTGGQT